MTATNIHEVLEALATSTDASSRKAEDERRATVMAWMEREHLTQTAAAAQLGISRETLRQWLMTADERVQFRSRAATYRRTYRKDTKENPQ